MPQAEEKSTAKGASLESVFLKPAKEKWESIGLKKRSGIAVPLFSLYSKNSLGIGDLDDLRLLIDWCKKTGNSIIQLLPLNETGPLFCPYDAVSSFALEPTYISLKRIFASYKRFPQDRLDNLKETFAVGKAHVDYRIKKEKLSILWDLFLEEKETLERDFVHFKEQNAYWLKDFALFKVLKRYKEQRAWYEWEDKYRDSKSTAISAFQREHPQEVVFEMWLQWHLNQQFRAVKEYAQSKGVLLKGDLPILVCRDSADVWAHPEFFKLEYAAGAPPDAYCAKGQRWGMPTYNWEAIAADNFRYIKEKLGYAQNFYDILRIDHVVGLFRIWSIPYQEPLENKGLHGFFDPADEAEWPKRGKRILSVMLENTKMLLCAEDLGVIPAICPQTLKELGIPGNDVQRWVKDWKHKHDFLSPQEYRALSVAMLSTHDTTNWPAWWENEAGTVDEQLFIRKCQERGIDYHLVKNRLFDFGRSRHARLRWQESVVNADILAKILGRRKEELADFIEMYENSYQEKEKLWQHLKIKEKVREESDAQIVQQALKITLDSEAIFCINLLIDWLYLADVFKGQAYQYRINTPGTVSDRNWSLVIPISLEELLKHKVNREIRSMIAASGRI